MDNKMTTHEPRSADRIKDAVCVDSSRIYDSCAEKDCLEDMRVFFTDEAQELVDQANAVRLKDVSVLDVLIDTEKVPFNKGFYTVDMTFYFKVELELSRSPGSSTCSVTGVVLFSKKVILYGSVGNVSIFSSEFRPEARDVQSVGARNMPKATVQVADPIGLDAKITEVCDICEPCPCIPSFIGRYFTGNLSERTPAKMVFVSIGIFTIVQLQRNVQLLLPAFDFCLPENECVSTTTENACDLFRKIEFPTEEFFPTKANDCTESCGSVHNTRRRCDF